MTEMSHSDRNGGILSKKRKNSTKIRMVGSYASHNQAPPSYNQALPSHNQASPSQNQAPLDGVEQY